MKDERIDNYIAQQKPWQQTVIKAVRAAIHRADSDMSETLKWDAPTFEHEGQVAWLFCATKWVHLSFRHGALLDPPPDGWEEDEHTESKAKRTLKFREGQPVNESAIERLVAQAVANNLVGKKVDFQTPKPGTREFDLPHEHEQWLREAEQLEDYLARPYYQQKGWIEWLEQAKTDATRAKRRDMIISELQHDQYMPNKDQRKPLKSS